MGMMFDLSDVRTFEIERRDQPHPGLRLWPSPASTTRELQREPRIKPFPPDSLLRAAAIESLVNSVVMEIEADSQEQDAAGLPRPNDACVRAALRIAREMAIKFYRQTWIDLAGFVSSTGRVAVLAHSMETGRRVTFYVSETAVEAIQTAVSGRPISSTSSIEAAASLLGWVSQH